MWLFAVKRSSLEPTDKHKAHTEAIRRNGGDDNAAKHEHEQPRWGTPIEDYLRRGELLDALRGEAHPMHLCARLGHSNQRRNTEMCGVHENKTIDERRCKGRENTVAANDLIVSRVYIL